MIRGLSLRRCATFIRVLLFPSGIFERAVSEYVEDECVTVFWVCVCIKKSFA